MVVGFSMDELADRLLGVRTGVDITVLPVVRVIGVFVGATTAFDVTLPVPFEESRCWAAFDCRSRARLDCAGVLQAWMPSYHV